MNVGRVSADASVSSNFWLTNKCPDFSKLILPKAVKIRLCALNFEPIPYYRINNLFAYDKY